jgi:hypothetical protein
VSITSLVVSIVVLAVFGYMGWLRPTGFASRTSKQREEDNKQDIATKWLKKDGE